MSEVVIYTIQSCNYCRAATEFMSNHNVEYTEIDVGNHQDKQLEMIEKSGQMGVPVIVIGKGDSEKIIAGFDQGKLTALLGIEDPEKADVRKLTGLRRLSGFLRSALSRWSI